MTSLMADTVRSPGAFSFWLSFARAKLGRVKCDPGTSSALRDCCAFSSLNKTLGSKQGEAGTSCDSELSGTVSLGAESEGAKPEKLPGGILSRFGVSLSLTCGGASP
jgi:hypothetical protein